MAPEDIERPAHLLQGLVREPAEVTGLEEREPCDPEQDRGFQIMGVGLLSHGVLPLLVQPTMPSRDPRLVQNPVHIGPNDPHLVQIRSKFGPNADGPASGRPSGPGWTLVLAVETISS